MLKPKEIPEPVSRSGRNLLKLVIWIAGYVAASALLNIYLPQLLQELSVEIAKTYQDYLGYLNSGIAIIFGYFIIVAFANLIYWNLRLRYPHATAQVMRNATKIIGIGALVATIAGGSAGGAAGVALGGFIGMVVGFATQKVLGQAIAGLFLLMIRPFRIGDRVVVAGEEGVVKDVTTFFTVIEKDGGELALIPNNNVIGGKINIKKLGESSEN